MSLSCIDVISLDVSRGEDTLQQKGVMYPSFLQPVFICSVVTCDIMGSCLHSRFWPWLPSSSILLSSTVMLACNLVSPSPWSCWTWRSNWKLTGQLGGIESHCRTTLSCFQKPVCSCLCSWFLSPLLAAWGSYSSSSSWGALATDFVSSEF